MDKINIEEVINKWFEMKYQTYDKLEHDDSIYLYYEGEKFAEIRIDKTPKQIIYEWKLYEELCDIIDMEVNEFEMVIIKWFEDTIGLRGFTAMWVFRSLILQYIPK